MSRCEKKDEDRLSPTECRSDKHQKTKPKRAQLRRLNSDSPGCMSMRTDRAMVHPAGFRKSEKDRPPAPSVASLQSYKSMDYPVVFKHGSFPQETSAELTSHQTNLNSVFMTLERDTIVLVKAELKELHRLLDPDRKSQDEDEEVVHCEEQESSKEAFLNIILHFLGTMNEGEIADAVLNSDFITSRSEEKDELPLLLSGRQSEKHDDSRSERSKLKRTKSAPPSCVPPQSDKSMDYPLGFKLAEQKPGPSTPSVVSFQSDKSMDYPLGFKQAEQNPGPSTPTVMSFQSEKSLDYPLGFKQAEQNPGTSTPSVMSCQSDKSMDYPLGFKHGSFLGVHQKAKLDSVFKILEENVVTFVKEELKNFHKLLNPESFQNQSEEEEMINCLDEEQKMRSKIALLNMTLQRLRRMKQEEVAYALLNKSRMHMCHCKLKDQLKKRLTYVFEGITNDGNPTHLNKIYTELYITEGHPAEVHCKHEVKLIEKTFMKPARQEVSIRCEDIFKPFSGSDKPVRTVITEGVAGIGKTVLTQKFALDWAEGKANQDIQFMFPISFRELNMVKTKNFSLVELIHLFFSETKEAGIFSFEEFQVLFIFDGLDECRFPLNMKSKDAVTDVTELTSLDVLLTNLIKGNLLPSARIWITTRPAAAFQIPPELVDLVTEVRGFTDPQKEDYFSKRFPEEEQATMIISHIKASRSLHIMCHIPIFCWISATVLEDALKTKEKSELPMSLTEMYVCFLVVLSKMKKVKYDDAGETDSLWSPKSRKMIQSLGKLAFEQLMKGNLFFYESDLTECGIDIKEATVYSGVFTEIFQEERGLFHENVFCFVHLSIQEFLAALHVHLTFTNSAVNLLSEDEPVSQASNMSSETFDLFYQTAIDKAVQSQNGHLDLFLRFLLGLSLKTNQTLLQGLVTEKEKGTSSGQNTIQYIKKMISETVCILKTNNLFHCLNELKDSSLKDGIQQTLKSGRLPTDKLPPAHWAALVNIILSSQETLERFDLKDYFESDAAVMGLLQVVVKCSKAVLSCCNLTDVWCSKLVPGLQSKCLILKELDMSNNDLKDSGVKLMSDGLCSPNCTLEILRLSGCLITKEGCEVLALSLGSNPSYLKELDLSYNHPEESGVKLLSAKLEDPGSALQTLKTEPSGSQFLKPGLSKYACDLTLDLDTPEGNLMLSDNNRKVTVGGEKPSHPDHPERSDVFEQLQCKDSLTGRCYWEVEWTGRVYMGVTYKGVKGIGESNGSILGMNNRSWILMCSDDGHSVLHNNKVTSICGAPSNRVGVYLDWPGGSLSFFRVLSGRLSHLQTFNTTFTEPVYPAFMITTKPSDSSLSLC